MNRTKASRCTARRLVVAALLAWAAAAQAQDEAGARLAAEVCQPCHGLDGNPAAPTFPILAGQSARYLYLQLQDFNKGRRSDPLMSPVAAKLSKEDMHSVADYLAAQKMRPIASDGDAERIRRGRAKSDQMLCQMCHLGEFRGQNEIPRVAGQFPEYITKQLRAFRARIRTNDAGNMAAVTQSLSDEDITDLASYISGLR